MQLPHKTLQHFLIQHHLLITHYTSLTFHFSYIKKPLIFYHFHLKKFFTKPILTSIKHTFIPDLPHTHKHLISLIQHNIK
ncbi:CDP-glycerol glycerophosphotransferase family protein, partial [Staphylococcus epidermidis]|uniref:CDP-glycerol glycerophosphotransferase family protein n=1 Tax=Staphylococcus epidermidis TaxID=1282 RepID=UPI0021B2CC11